MVGALKRGLPALVLVLALSVALSLVLAACGRPASSALSGRPAPDRAASTLQEVAPPGAVQQLKSALDRHQPQLTIKAPADGSLLPPGPWTLELILRDWPLVDAGALGLGPHLVVQIDDRAPIRITEAEAAAGDGIPTRRVRLALDPLSPGSHRITTYAARPWGEAVKDPGASAQITVHRVAPTPLTQPQAGEPQLLPVSPPFLSGGEPVLIDWLLRDAPLQHLRDGDTHWRLRVTVNGDSFQVDRQIPLWLKGFRPGSNAVLLELLDGLGEPIAPAINTVVQEVILRPDERPLWSRNRLEPEVMAALLGDGPQAGKATPGISTGSGEAVVPTPSPASQASRPTIPQPAPEPATTQPSHQPGPERITEPGPAAQAPPAPGSEPGDALDRTATAGEDPNPAPSESISNALANPNIPETAQDNRDQDNKNQNNSGNRGRNTTVQSNNLPNSDLSSPSSGPSNGPSSGDEGARSEDSGASASPPAAAAAEAAESMEPIPADTPVSISEPSDDPSPAEQPVPAPLQPPARSELNADGSVIRPKRQGLLSGLRGGAS